MRTIWHSLLWKEWHEHKWKLASIVAILWVIVAYSLVNLEREVDLVQLVVGLVVLCMMPLSVFVALGDAAGERSRNTLPFLQALPLSTRRVAAAKLLLGLATLIAAIAVTSLLIYAWSRVSPVVGASYASSIERMARGGAPSLIGDPLVDLILTAAAVAASLYLWSAAAGVNRKDEVSAGAAALLTIVGVWMLLFVVGRLLSPVGTWRGMSALAAVAVGSAPGGGGALSEMARNRGDFTWLNVAIAFTIHAALAVVFVRRFGRVANREIVSPRGERVDEYVPATIGPARRSPLTAVLWKQVRESGPIALAGLAVVVAVVVVVAIGDLNWYLGVPRRLAEMFAGICVSMGMAVAMVVGIGAFFYDTGPQLNTFWRSRPISPNLWFSSKILTGLAILLAAVYIPTLLALAASGMITEEIMREPEVLIFPAAHMAIFAAAVAMTCLVRHAVYAAILSIPATFIGVLMVSGALFVAARLGWLGEDVRDDWYQQERYAVLIYGGGLTLSVLVNTLLAWLAMRYDLGRKSRY